jgi:hypothetical protein
MKNKKSKRFTALIACMAMMVLISVPKLPTYAAFLSVNCTCSSPSVRYDYITSYPINHVKIFYFPIGIIGTTGILVKHECTKTGTMNMFHFYCTSCGADLGDKGNEVSVAHSDPLCIYTHNE